MEGAETAGEALSRDDFFERARARLTLDTPEGLNDPAIIPRHGDHQIDPVIQAMAEIRPIRPAAVLVPIVDHPSPTVLLTVRTAHLPDHPGQIAFPGGKIEAEDKSPLAASMREAWEEIGLEQQFVEPLGYLDLYMTSLGYRIVPALARVRPGFRLTLNASEVDDTFEVPLAFLMAEANHKQESRAWKGMMRTVYAMPFGERYIWGVTAGILRNLYLRLYRD